MYVYKTVRNIPVVALLPITTGT
uniref:Uncharacterized protein n=1 Tax=Anguilla anguilla TaxID=7936 RepID=A0A0E9V1J8_ANGAN